MQWVFQAFTVLPDGKYSPHLLGASMSIEEAEEWMAKVVELCACREDRYLDLVDGAYQTIAYAAEKGGISQATLARCAMVIRHFEAL